MGTADIDYFPIDGDDFQAEQVVGGDAVFETVGAAGVHVDVAADHARQLRRWVGGVEETIGGDGVGDADVGDSGLDDGIFHRQGAAGEGGAGAAGDHADSVLVAVF